jgi:hypothetical protein
LVCQALSLRRGWVKDGETYRAIQDVFVALAADFQLNVRRITGCNVGLGHQESRADLALQQGLKPLLLLCIVTVLGEYLHVASIWGSIVGSLVHMIVSESINSANIAFFLAVRPA